MISVVYCTREPNPKHTEHIIKTSGLHKHIEVIEIINNGESLTKSYNRGLKQSKNDIVVFCHDDIIIETKQWGKKLNKLFINYPEYGIIGVAGSKYMPKSGRWWEDRNQMFGKVKHTNNGKSWLSEYSVDLGNSIEETVIVDGLWFAIDKNKINTSFDETVEGFHFYDVSFCFQNHLNGVKVGVTTKIRVNHMSIGQTNEEWEKNRIKFANKYSKELPIKIKQDFTNVKMKVLLGCLNYKGLTGSEISTFQLSKALKEKGCDVHVYSNIGGILSKKAKKLGINLHNLDSPPGYKMGDGKWVFNVNGQKIISQKEKLYKVKDVKFDIIQINHQPIGKTLLNLYPKNKFVNIVRSRMLPVEYPILDERIKKYIAINEVVEKFMIDNYENITAENVEMIYNIAEEKNTTNNSTDVNIENFILLPGTMNYLRKNMVYDITEKTKISGEKLVLVGNDNDFGYAKKLSEENEHVIYYDEMSDLSGLYEKCNKVCGLYLGRTLIEGFKHNKKGVGYLVDDRGNIEDIMTDVYPEDINLFDSDYISNQYLDLYKEVINSVDIGVGELNDSDTNGVTTIEQMRVAPGLSFFKEKLLKKYGLKDYTDVNKACVFNGLYTMQDYMSLINHKSHKTVVWCGSDAQHMNKNLIKQAGKIRHIAKSKFISETLTKQGIPHIVLPITPTSPVKNYKEKKGENIYFYRGENRKKYGGDLVDIIKERTNYNIIEADSKTFNEGELNSVYESCFMGLRLTKHDGLPNTVLELGLMGRNCVHNGNTPNSLNYGTVEDIISHIDNEYNKKNDNSEGVVDDVYNFLDINSDWLNVYDE
jgi:hypothetical protein